MDPKAKLTAQARIRRNFIAGLFAVLPIIVTILILNWIDTQCIKVVDAWNSTFPSYKITIQYHLGIIIAVALIYLTGVLTSSLLGKWVLKIVDAILSRLPGIRQLYMGWKQIALTPGGQEGIYSNVVLIPDDSATKKIIGFTGGQIVATPEPCYCVFVPSVPSPINGRLYFVPVEKCQFIELSPEEAFKFVLSTGNYVPPLLFASPPAMR